VFLNEHATEVAPYVTPIARARLDALVAEGTTLELQQLSSTGIGIGETAIWDQIQSGLFEEFLEPAASFEKRLNLNDPRLIVPGKVAQKGEYMTQLEVLADTLPEYKEELLAYGLSADFIPRFRAAVDALKKSTDSRGRAWGDRSGATGGLAQVNADIRLHLLVLDRALIPLLQKDGAFKAGWDAARRIHQDPIEPRRGGRVDPPKAEEPPKRAKPPESEQPPEAGEPPTGEEPPPISGSGTS
jgi:hypothetical protein